MGLVGMGRAFNLRFMPNGPLRTNCYHRPMPHVGIFGGGGNFSYTENINIQQGPTGFWGFMSGLCQGLFGGGMFGMGGGLFGCGMGGGLFGMLNARQATPQGAGGQKNPDLDNLNAFFGSKGYIIRMEKDGTYTAAKDGKIVASGSYDDVKTKLSDLADTSDDTTTKKDTPDELAKTHKPPLTKGDDGKWKDEAGNVYEWDADNKSFDKQENADAGSDDGAAVGDGDDAAEGAGSGAGASSGAGTPIKPKKVPKPKNRNTSVVNHTMAEADGKTVSDYLVGYTTVSDQNSTTQIIKSRVNDKNVVSFLKGYENNKGPLGSQFFTQLISEYGYDEKHELISHTAKQLIKYCNDNNKADLASKIKNALDTKNYPKLDILKNELLQ